MWESRAHLFDHRAQHVPHGSSIAVFASWRQPLGDNRKCLIGSILDLLEAYPCFTREIRPVQQRSRNPPGDFDRLAKIVCDRGGQITASCNPLRVAKLVRYPVPPERYCDLGGNGRDKV